MDIWLMRSPWWLQSLLMGAAYVAGQVVAGQVIDNDPHYGTAFFGGLAFGGLLSPVIKRQQRRLLAAAQPLPRDRVKEALLHAAVRGPAPLEPPVRDAAIRVTRHRLLELTRNNRRAVVVLPILVLATLAVAFSVSLWLLASTAVMIGIGVYQVLLLPHRMTRRLVLLEAASSSGTSSVTIDDQSHP